MMKFKSPAFKISCFLCFLCFLCLAFLPRLNAAEPTVPVSPGLSVLAEQSPMAMAGMVGSEISFEEDDFARAMNLSRVRSVTITKTPPIGDGELRVGNTVVNRGQTIRSSQLSLLSYVPSSQKISDSSFRFTVNDSPVEMTCSLYLLRQINHAPTLKAVPKTALSVSTHQNITLWGELPSYDPDGDRTEVEIVSYPKTGILVLTDKQSGSYTYTPGVNHVGKDSFTYVVRDMYGNYSASATVSLQVVKPSTSVVYADLLNDPSYNAALTVTEAGLMSGIQSQNATYFRPELPVSRGEFLVLAMKAMGINNPGEATKTVFADDADLQKEERNYVAAAYELGYIKGEPSENTLYFYPDRTVTRAEAAVILGRMLQASAPTMTPIFSDEKDIPTFAEASVYSMASLGILSAENGNIRPLSVMNRRDTAEMLSAMLLYRNN